MTKINDKQTVSVWTWQNEHQCVNITFTCNHEIFSRVTFIYYFEDTSFTLFVKKYCCGKDQIFSQFNFLNNLFQYEIPGEIKQKKKLSTISTRKRDLTCIISNFFPPEKHFTYLNLFGSSFFI